MAKIAQVSAKYIVHAEIQIQGVVDKPDVIGAIFGQTEGLLGADLELRELQRSGRIGRIEVNVDIKSGKTAGEIIIPSSLDKAETAIIAAALEIIQRIGPCNAKIHVGSIEDVRISKRQFVVERAKELLKALMDTSMPDSQELADEVAYSVRVMEIQEYGRERLPAGPAVDESDDVIVVEGRADVINLLKHGFKNVIALNGTSVPETIVELSRKKTLTVFVDGDRGGNLIVQELLAISEIDFVTRAPDGKEVEELTKKEIHKALRGRVAAEQARMEFMQSNDKRPAPGPVREQRPEQRSEQRPEQREMRTEQRDRPEGRPEQRSIQREPPQLQKNALAQTQPLTKQPKRKMTTQEKESFGHMLEDLIGTRGAYVLDPKLNILGKVPVSELQGTIKSLKTGIYAIVFDGIADRDLVATAERANIQFLIAMDNKVKEGTHITIITPDEL